MTEDGQYHFHCVNRNKVIRRIAQLDAEKKKVLAEKRDPPHMWSDRDLYNQIIGELQDLIY